MTEHKICPLCNYTLSKPCESKYKTYKSDQGCNCDLCGDYGLTNEAWDYLNHEFSEAKKPLVSRYVYRRRLYQNEFTRLDTRLLEHLRDEALPTLSEMIELLIVDISDRGPNPGQQVNYAILEIGLVVGTYNTDTMRFLSREIDNLDFAKSRLSSSSATFELSLKGWGHVEDIRRGATDSKKVFMAMKFGDEELNQIVKTVFKPAVAKTGFVLETLLDDRKAGLINNHLETKIHACKFLIADLSHDNLGAYWEAGFAEGLGKSVIYTCRRDKFEQRGTHFDINHHQTVVWDPNDLKGAAEDMKDTIRATFPSEAILED